MAFSQRSVAKIKPKQFSEFGSRTNISNSIVLIGRFTFRSVSLCNKTWLKLRKAFCLFLSAINELCYEGSYTWSPCTLGLHDRISIETCMLTHVLWVYQMKPRGQGGDLTFRTARGVENSLYSFPLGIRGIFYFSN